MGVSCVRSLASNCRLQVSVRSLVDGTVASGRVNLIDLAGSVR